MANNDVFTQPNPGYFGVTPETVGQTEAQSPNNPMLIGMMMQGRAAQQGYLQSLGATQQLELMNEERNRQKDLANTVLSTAGSNKEVLPYLMTTDGSGHANPYLMEDGAGLERVSALSQAEQASQTLEHNANAFGTLAEKAGYVVDPTVVGDYLKGINPSPAPVPHSMQPTSNANDAVRAAASMKAAEASQTAANNSGKNGNKTVTTYIPDGKGGFIPMSVVNTDAGGGTVNVLAPSGGGGPAASGGGQGGKVTVYMRGGGVHQVAPATAQDLVNRGAASLTPPR